MVLVVELGRFVVHHHLQRRSPGVVASEVLLKDLARLLLSCRPLTRMELVLAVVAPAALDGVAGGDSRAHLTEEGGATEPSTDPSLDFLSCPVPYRGRGLFKAQFPQPFRVENELLLIGNVN